MMDERGQWFRSKKNRDDPLQVNTPANDTNNISTFWYMLSLSSVTPWNWRLWYTSYWIGLLNETKYYVNRANISQSGWWGSAQTGNARQKSNILNSWRESWPALLCSHQVADKTDDLYQCHFFSIIQIPLLFIVVTLYCMQRKWFEDWFWNMKLRASQMQVLIVGNSWSPKCKKLAL